MPRGPTAPLELASRVQTRAVVDGRAAAFVEVIEEQQRGLGGRVELWKPHAARQTRPVKLSGIRLGVAWWQVCICTIGGSYYT